MHGLSRRHFLADVGTGMLVAGLGPAAFDLELASARAGDGPDTLSFGALEPLVGVMQDTPADKLLPILVERTRGGTDLKTLVAAGALANARSFGGQDYTGYHALMALAPAFAMSEELTAARRALPVLKVLHRNTKRIQEQGGRANEVLHAIEAEEHGAVGAEALRDATRSGDVTRADRAFATMARAPVGEAFNHLQFAVQDEIDVHRVVLAWRAWALLDFTGPAQAQTLLRQSVRFCADAERQMNSRGGKPSAIRTLLPKLMDQYHLPRASAGSRVAEDAWVSQLAATIYSASRDQSADAVAAALAEGFSADSVGEALALAANRLVLCDPGRVKGDADKPAGSVHGASVGVHASDAVNAWRNIASVSNPRNAAASLIVGAFHTAGQTNGQRAEAWPLREQVDAIKETDAGLLLRRADEAIRAKDQAGACAAVARYGALGHSEKPAFAMLLGYACSEDGALHAEKYYRTVVEDFATSRPAFRWRHLAALARVTASEYGYPAPGYAEACRLIGG